MEDLNHMLWRNNLASGVWGSSFQTFGMASTHIRDIGAMIEELLGQFFGKKEKKKVGSLRLLKSLQFYGFYAVSGRNRVFREYTRILGSFSPFVNFMFSFEL